MTTRCKHGFADPEKDCEECLEEKEIGMSSLPKKIRKKRRKRRWFRKPKGQLVPIIQFKNNSLLAQLKSLDEAIHVIIQALGGGQ